MAEPGSDFKKGNIMQRYYIKLSEKTLKRLSEYQKKAKAEKQIPFSSFQDAAINVALNYENEIYDRIADTIKQ
jgi:hypothetical protein